MSIKVAVIQQAVTAAIATQEFTSAGFGTPKAAMFIVTRAIANNTSTAHNALTLGFTDGVRSRSVCATSSDGEILTATRRGGQEVCAYGIDPPIENQDYQGAFSQWVTDGVEINWTAAPNSAFLMTVILFGGTDLQVHVNEFIPSIAENSTLNITDPGFLPDQIIMIGTDKPFPTTADNHCRFGFGFADRGSSISQGAIGYTAVNNAITTNNTAHTSNNRTWVNGHGGTSQAEVTDFLDNGFEVTTRENAATVDGEIAYLALKYSGSGGSANHSVFVMDTPILAGNDVITTPGFKPQALLIGGSFVEIINTNAGANPVANTASFGATDGTNEFCSSVSDKDGIVLNLPITSSLSLVDNKLVRLTESDGTGGHAGTLTSFDPGGFTINYSATDGTARKYIVMAIGEFVPADTGGTTVSTSEISISQTNASTLTQRVKVLETTIVVANNVVTGHTKTQYRLYENHANNPFLTLTSTTNIAKNGNIRQLTKNRLGIILTHNTKYKVSVRAYGSSGWSPWSDLKSFRTRDMNYRYIKGKEPTITVTSRGATVDNR